MSKSKVDWGKGVQDDDHEWAEQIKNCDHEYNEKHCAAESCPWRTCSKCSHSKIVTVNVANTKG